MKQAHHDALDSLRGLACLGIVMMHLWANTDYGLTGFFFDRVVASFTDFVFLFMELSAFCLCCGYQEKILAGQLDVTAFYRRRFERVWPFFALIVLAEAAAAPSRAAVYEAFADLTLCFGFLPQPETLQVAGVGWYLGLLTVFWLCFPCFCVLMAEKRRAWAAFAVSLLWNFAGAWYFSLTRSSILYSGCFFLAGGLVYQNRQRLASCPRWLRGLAAGCAVVFYYAVGGGTLACLLVSTVLLALALPGGSRLLEARPLVRFGRISFEIYLCHMAVFRVLERLDALHPFGRSAASYAAALAEVLIGAGLCAVLFRRVSRRVGGLLCGKQGARQ